MNQRAVNENGYDNQGLDKDFNLMDIIGTGELNAVDRIICRSTGILDLVRRLETEETHAVTTDVNMHRLAQTIKNLFLNAKYE